MAVLLQNTGSGCFKGSLNCGSQAYLSLAVGFYFPDQRVKAIPCIGRRIHNHWSIREVPQQRFIEEQPWAGSLLLQEVQEVGGRSGS